MRIGLDFDNTIICYDKVFVDTAIEQGLIPFGFTGNKQDVRDAIRLLEDGETRWQMLQGFVYGRGIGGAHAFEGLDKFLMHARDRGDTVLIVSHKTEYGHFDPERVSLREAARGWMRDNDFFSRSGFGIDTANVHFAATRAEKLARIDAVRCDVFIDDLKEVLDDPAFPPGPERILFSARSDDGSPPDYPVLATWAAIGEYVFDKRADG